MSRLAALGTATQKKTFIAAERNEEARQLFRQQVSDRARERLVFIDESGFHLAMARHYGRASKGVRAVQSVPTNRGVNLSVIGALRLQGVVASLSVAGAIDTPIFDTYITELFLPQIKVDDVVLLDNLPVHLASHIEAAVASVKGEVLWLPAYSPDFSPVEPFWSKVKTSVRGKEPRTGPELNTALTDAINSVSVEDIDGWFRYCGY
ncbi:MAG: IS630 family transposase [Acidobacteria bacterium]|nr:IS630 family transposase [Acidobacteriota bacterium]